MDALFNENKQEIKDKNKSKQKKKQNGKTNNTLGEEIESVESESCTCEEEEYDGFELDEDFLSECEEEENETCRRCMNTNCEVHPLHDKVLADKHELPMYIGNGIADDILALSYESLIELLNVKELCNDSKNDAEIVEILREVEHKLVLVTKIITDSKQNFRIEC